MDSALFHAWSTVSDIPARTRAAKNLTTRQQRRRPNGADPFSCSAIHAGTARSQPARRLESALDRPSGATNSHHPAWESRQAGVRYSWTPVIGVSLR